MFKRRKKHGFLRKMREAAWPTIGFKRAARYMGARITRLAEKDNGNALSKSIACGVTASFFPALGIHAAIAGLMAFCMRAPVIAAVLGTLLVPPFVLPFLFVLDFIVGRKFLSKLGFEGWGSEAHFERETSDFNPTWFLEHFEKLFLPAFVGFLIFLPLVWSASYMATRKVIDLLREHYARKRKEKKQQP